MRHRKRASPAGRGIIVTRVCKRVRVYRCSSDIISLVANGREDGVPPFHFSSMSSLSHLPRVSLSLPPGVDTSRRFHGTKVGFN